MMSYNKYEIEKVLEKFGYRDKNKINKISKYLELLLKWNSIVNLISNNDGKVLIKRHLEDSLYALKFLKEERYKNIIDLGSGNGFPSIPLSIMLEIKNFTLVEIKTKKYIFLKEVKGELDLKNVEILKTRAESLDFSVFDIVLSRAFKNIDQIKNLLKQKNYEKDVLYWEKVGIVKITKNK